MVCINDLWEYNIANESIPTVLDFAAAYSSIIPDSNYNEFCDFDDDGNVDGSDLAEMAAGFK